MLGKEPKALPKEPLDLYSSQILGLLPPFGSLLLPEPLKLSPHPFSIVPRESPILMPPHPSPVEFIQSSHPNLLWSGLAGTDSSPCVITTVTDMTLMPGLIRQVGGGHTAEKGPLTPPFLLTPPFVPAGLCRRRWLPFSAFLWLQGWEILSETL